MAGDNVYIGEMFSDLGTKMQAVVDSMASQVTKFDEQIAALGVINTSVAQGVSSVVLEPTDTIYQSFTHAAQAQTGVTTWSGSFLKIKSIAAGVVKVAVEMKSNGGSYSAALGYSLDGGTTVVQICSTTATVLGERVGNMPVGLNQEITFHCKISAAGAICTITENTLKIKATKKDIVTNGAFVAM